MCGAGALVLIGCADGGRESSGDDNNLSTAAIRPQDLQYEGAFLLPRGTFGGSRWGYGGTALTYYPHGDPGDPGDGYPGSLFGAGHGSHDMVGESSIPPPVISERKSTDDLPIAHQLQPFLDIAGDFKKRVQERGLDTLGGLAYLPTDGRLYWNFFRYYAVQPLPQIDDPTHGRSSLELAYPQAEGMWHVGPYGNPIYHQKKTANYMFDIPRAWADRHLPGMYLATGKGNGAGNAGGSHGPALFAVEPPGLGSSLPDGAPLEARALLYYPPGESEIPDWRPCDVWEGGAWIEAGGRSAVLIAGRKALGETYYGKGREGDCQAAKGYHCPPYEPQFLLYDPDELALVARDELEPHEVLPYAVIRLTKEMWPTCHYRLGGAAFDRQRGLLYVVQQNQEKPIVHVWRVVGG